MKPEADLSAVTEARLREIEEEVANSDAGPNDWTDRTIIELVAEVRRIRSLLKRYIEHIENQESVDYLHYNDWPTWGGRTGGEGLFTRQEWEELRALSGGDHADQDETPEARAADDR